MDKIKVFLVDDEYLERTLIRCCIPWDDYDCEIVGEAESGEDMLKQIDSVRPDIIFTDICMPFMDGIEMAKIVKERYSETQIVIITGHRDFEYAKSAIHIGVSDYLLKPIDKNELIQIIQKLKNRIDNENKEKFIKTMLQKNEDIINKKRHSELVEKTLELIEKSLSDSELSLKTIAEKLCVNPCYLSRIFKQEIHENITDYIIKLRINRSIEFLNSTNLKAYEIAEKVGINDSHYFSILFKKQTGKSIQEFKKQCRITA